MDLPHSQTTAMFWSSKEIQISDVPNPSLAFPKPGDHSPVHRISWERKMWLRKDKNKITRVAGPSCAHPGSKGKVSAECATERTHKVPSSQQCVLSPFKHSGNWEHQTCAVQRGKGQRAVLNSGVTAREQEISTTCLFP